MCFDFTKMAPEMKVQTFFFIFWRSCFLVFSGKLGEIWAKSFAPPNICLLQTYGVFSEVIFF